MPLLLNDHFRVQLDRPRVPADLVRRFLRHGPHVKRLLGLRDRGHRIVDAEADGGLPGRPALSAEQRPQSRRAHKGGWQDLPQDGHVRIPESHLELLSAGPRGRKRAPTLMGAIASTTSV